MLEIKLTIDNMDYDKAMDLILPLLAESDTKLGRIAKKHSTLLGKIGHRFVSKKGQTGMEELIASLAEKKNEILREKLSNFAKQKGLDLHISVMSVTSK